MAIQLLRLRDARKFHENPTCSACGYLLRGVIGVTKVCPECGADCTLQALEHEWCDRQWASDPAINSVLWPFGWTFVASTTGIIVLLPLYLTAGAPGAAWYALVVVLVWFRLIIGTKRDMGGEGVRLALMLHVGGWLFMVGIVGMAYSVSWVVEFALYGEPLTTLTTLALVAPIIGTACLIFGLRQIRPIFRRCREIGRSQWRSSWNRAVPPILQQDESV